MSLGRVVNSQPITHVREEVHESKQPSIEGKLLVYS